MRLDPAILKPALLGTKNIKFDSALLPEAVRERLRPSPSDEETLLDALTLYTRYIESGSKLPKLEGVSEMPVCSAETLTYAPGEYHDFLTLLLAASAEASAYYLPALCGLLRERDEILSPELLFPLSQKLKYTSGDLAIYEAFGERGRWLYSQKSELTPETLDMNSAQRRTHFTQIMEDAPSAIAFLDEFIDAENISTRFSYLKLLYDRNRQPNPQLFGYFRDKVTAMGSKSQTYDSMLRTLTLLELNDPASPLFGEYFEHYFAPIWRRESSKLGSMVASVMGGSGGKLVLRDTDELTTLLAPLEPLAAESYYDYPRDLEGIDRLLYFVITVVPPGRWAERFDLPLAKALDAIAAVKPQVSKAKATNTIEHLNYLGALDTNLIKYGERDAALELFRRGRFDLITPGFLKLLSEENAKEFIIKHIDAFDPNQNLLRFVSRELGFTHKWSRKFTETILRHSLGRYADNSIKGDLWRCAPYLDNDFIAIVEAKNGTNYYSSNLYETLFEIERIKKAFTTLQEEKQ